MVEQWAENPCVASSILVWDIARFTRKWRISGINKMLFNSKLTYLQTRRPSQYGPFLQALTLSPLTYPTLTTKILLTLPIPRGLRVRFKGKTLKAKKTSKKCYWFNLGWSHLTESFINYGVCSKIRSKQRLVFWSYSKRSLDLTASRFCSLKPTNLYHARGIRRSRTRRLFKDGKVSTYR